MNARESVTVATGARQALVYRFVGLTLDPATRHLFDAKGTVDVPRRVFDCLAYLVEHRERAVGRDELIRRLWGHTEVTDTQLAQMVLRARRVVGDDGVAQNVIRTVPGFGYHWVGAVEAVPAAAQANELLIDLSARADEPDDAPAQDIIASTEPAHVAPIARTRAMPTRRRRAVVALVTALAVLGIVIAITLTSTDPKRAPTAAHATSRPRIIVLPVRVADDDRASWARLGMMDLIATRLSDGGLVVTPSENVLALIAANGGAQRIDPARLRERTQAEIVVRGATRRLASGWQVDLEGLRADGLDLHVSGQHAELVEAAVAASDALLESLGRDHAGKAHGSESLQRVRAAILANELDLARDLFARLPEAERARIDTRYFGAQLDLRAGQYAKARATLDDLIATTRDGGDRAALGRMLLARGSAAMWLTDFPASDRDFLEAVTVLEHTEARRDYGLAIMGRGLIRFRLNQFDDAAADFNQSRMALASAGDDIGVAKVMVDSAIVLIERNQYLQALPVLEEAIRILQTYGDIDDLSKALAGAADLNAKLLRWTSAGVFSERANEMLPRLPNKDLRELVTVVRADALMGQGHLQEAARALDSLGADDAPRDCLGCGPRRLSMAKLALLHDRPAQARALVDKVWSIPLSGWSRDLRDHALLMGVQTQIQAIATQGELAPAWPRDWTDRLTQGDFAPVRTAHGLRLLHEGDIVAAERELRAALAQAQAQSNLQDVLAATAPLADLLLGADRVDEASAVIGPLASAAEEDFDCAMLLVRLYHRQGDEPGWRRALDRARALAGERQVPVALAQAPGPRGGPASDTVTALADETPAGH